MKKSTSEISVIAYSKDKFMSTKVSSLEEALSFRDYTVVWINVIYSPALDAELKKLGVSNRVIKAIKRDSSARVFIFPDYIFVILHQVYEVAGSLKREKTSILLMNNVILTIQERPRDVFNIIRESIREGEGSLRRKGPGYLFVEILDAIIENYVPILEKISAEIEKIESKILANPDQGILRKIHKMRRDVLFMRRTILPLLTCFRRIKVEGKEFLDAETENLLEDLYAHVRDILEVIETQKELTDSLVDIYYSTISMKINEIIRILTVVSTIFIPLTFITGIYGMNFRYMPELQWRYGYPAVLVVMFALAIGMLLYFKKKKWL
ncbi:magnesium/cobalt transporter CorA [Pyrococcus horikoshii]|uniref:Magnesium transport protein CorA n=2 Tax=Pyrococcus horikoshii TaxID=53953 RepID=O57887_PYRHO|nr:magnesium/cobalt transporter CorA [Pyrococcus horikoshii]BAA29213.1 323aa long hypothetical magnesium and cobalt transport protein [Pyrococcus horikoshii OT3]HII61510.1 magnesium/cobalt transporter CorA [Pyrococcus horikoshii]